MHTRRVVLTSLGLSVVSVGSLGAHASLNPSGVPMLLTRPDWYRPLDRARGRTDASNVEWLESGRVPGRAGPYGPMVEAALLDLRRLTEDSGAVAAGAGPQWRYTWPRDAAFVAVALDRTGHADDAERILRFLASLQGSDGSLEARYLLDRPGVPDRRPRQEDGPGWVLWALAESSRSGQEDSRDGPAPALTRRPLTLPDDLRVMVDRSTDRLLRLTRDGRRMPPASPDYWEVPESEPPLGQVAPMAAGLLAAHTLYVELGDARRAAQVGAAANAFRSVVRGTYGPSWQRHPGSGGRDAATAMAMPPFLPEEVRLAAAWVDYQQGALRPGGGLAPGTAWWRHGESWTPEVALVAYTAAASNRPNIARAWLDWLDAQRLPWGSLPEKVLADGSPAGPAPLAWTAALVVLAVAELETSPVP